MAVTRSEMNGRLSLIFLIAILIVLHLFAAHGHADVTALEACVVLLVPLVAALLAGRKPVKPSGIIPVSAVVTRMLPDEVRRLLPADIGTVMRH